MSDISDFSDDDEIEYSRPTTSRRNARIMPIINRRNTLFTCSDCFSSFHNDHCNIFYYCQKCKLYQCTFCYNNNGKKCVQGCRQLSIYINPNKDLPPEDINSFIEVVEKKTNKCCRFKLFFYH